MRFQSLIIRPATLLVFLVMMLPENPLAQEVVWTKNTKLDKKTDFTKVIGQNRFGLYVLKHKNSNFRKYFILEYFDKRMNLLKTKSFRIPNSTLEKIVVQKEQIIYFCSEYSKGNLVNLYYQTIDSSFTESPRQILTSAETPFDKIQNVQIEYSNSRSVFVVWYLKENLEHSGLFYKVLKNNRVIRNGSSPFPYKNSDLYIGDAITDDSGNLFMLYTYSLKFKSKNATDFKHKYFALNTATGKSVNILLNDESSFMSAYKLVYNPAENYVSAFCLNGTVDEEENKTYSIVMLNCSDLSIRKNISVPFDRKIVGLVNGIKSEQRGENLSKFKIRKLIPKTDGGFLVICERIYITTQSDIFYVNGIAQSSYSRIFNNDEVLLMNFDSSGSVIWTDIIFKNQNSVNDGGYYNGIVIMVNEGTIHILYNDRLNPNADIILVTYYANGTHSKKILLNSDEYYALLIPSESGQVSLNSIVLPVNQNREFTYLKLLF